MWCIVEDVWNFNEERLLNIHNYLKWQCRSPVKYAESADMSFAYYNYSIISFFTCCTFGITVRLLTGCQKQLNVLLSCFG